MFQRTPRLLIVIVAVLFFVTGTYFAIRLARGYRPSLASRALQGTGLLAANSVPRGASVFLNDKLTTATDDTLNLPPGQYRVKIAQDGYIPWEKTLVLEAELVAQTNARLFPSVPDLKPLTFSGALNLPPSPDGQKIAFAVGNATTNDKNGLYVLDLFDRPFGFNSEPRQISRPHPDFDFTVARLTWSPDSSQILVSVNLNQPDERNILLSVSSLNDIATLKDATARLPVTLSEWHELLDKKDHERLVLLPEFMQKVATESARAVYWSPDEDKLMYTAVETLTIPENLIPPVPASSTQVQRRNLEKDNIYIYDLEEDKNFWLAAAPATDTPGVKDSSLETLSHRYSPIHFQPVQWFPDSRHYILVQEGKIVIGEYDGTNQDTVYAGPFSDDFAYPWPNGSRLIILASLNGGSNQPPNLYSINLK